MDWMRVAFPADQAAFSTQAATGSLYIEFDVPRDSVKQTQSGWAKILGPHTLEARLAAAKGQPIPQMPTNNFQKIQFEAVQSPDGQSMIMDLSLPKYLARVTLGSLGTSAEYYDTEIIHTETEETTHWQHQEFGSAVELNAALTDFFLRLRDLPDTEVSALDQHIHLNNPMCKFK